MKTTLLSLLLVFLPLVAYSQTSPSRAIVVIPTKPNTTTPTTPTPVAPSCQTPFVTSPMISVPATAPVAVPPVVVSDNGGTVQVSDIITSGAEVVAAVKAYQASKKDPNKDTNKLAIRIGIMLILAAVFKVLISALKLTSQWWGTDMAKNIIRLITIGLGIAVFLISSIATGETWGQALLLGLSGPLAISINEIVDVLVQMFHKTTEALKKLRKVPA